MKLVNPAANNGEYTSAYSQELSKACLNKQDNLHGKLYSTYSNFKIANENRVVYSFMQIIGPPQCSFDFVYMLCSLHEHDF